MNNNQRKPSLDYIRELSDRIIKLRESLRKSGISDSEIEQRLRKMEESEKPFQANRDRTVSLALQAYALMATSADRGAVRDISNIGVINA